MVPLLLPRGLSLPLRALLLSFDSLAYNRRNAADQAPRVRAGDEFSTGDEGDQGAARGVVVGVGVARGKSTLRDLGKNRFGVLHCLCVHHGKLISLQTWYGREKRLERRLT